MTKKPTISQKTQTAQIKKAKPNSTKVGSGIENSVDLDAKNPIPFEYGGMAFRYVQDQAYSPFLPPLDDFGLKLMEARILSNTHNACIKTKRDYCTGVGFYDIKDKELPIEITDWFTSMNLRNQSSTDINKQTFESHFTFGNTPIEVVRLTVAGKKKLFIYPHNFLEWRLGQENDEGFIDYAIHSKLLYKKGYLSSDQVKNAKRLPIYNALKSDKDNWQPDLKDKSVERTLIWYKNPVAGYSNYGLPSAISSLIYQVLEYKGARYNLDEFDNNMIVSALLVLAGQVSESEATKITRKIVKEHTGDGKRGRVIAVASEEGIKDANLLNMSTTKDGSYNESDDRWTQKIILANEWDAVLAGIVHQSSMGKGSGFLTKIQEIKLNTVIKPAQDDLMKNVWNPIFKIAQDWLSIPFDQYNLGIKNIIDISGLTDVDITPAVQVNEVRKAKGLPEDPKMNGVYMKPVAPQNQNTGGDNV